MLTHRGYRYRIYPSRAQRTYFASAFGCCRYVYNACLQYKREIYAAEHRTAGDAECMRLVTALKQQDGTAWLAGCDSMALQEAVKDLGRAQKAFFEKRAGFPKFRRKSDGFQSFRTRNQGNGVRITDKNHVRIPVAGILKAKVSRLPSGRILNATVERVPSGKYFLSLCVEEELSPLPNTGGRTGIDVGLKSFCTDSSGRIIDHPRTIARYEKKLVREMWKLSRMIEADITGYGPKHRPVFRKPLSECRNIGKQRRRVARIHEKVRNTRQDFLHKLSTEYVRNNEFLAVEDLYVKGMVRNHHLAKAISDSGWSRFFLMLEYKSFRYGCTVVRVPRFYPSSQTCSVCGHKNRLVKDLKIRAWTCPECGARHDRDYNAAANILAEGMRSLGA